MKTKTILLAVILLLGLTPLARAQQASVTPFDYTGNENEAVIVTGASSWSPDPDSTTVDPVALGSTAIAQQFTVTSQTDFIDLETDTVLLTQPPYLSIGQTASTTLTWSIYSGNSYTLFGQTISVPLPGTFLVSSAPVTYTAGFGDNNPLVNNYVAMDADLAPGTYWIAESGTGDLSVDPTQSYMYPANYPLTSPVPEPPTIWLFLVAAVGFIWLKRKDLVFGRLP